MNDEQDFITNEPLPQADTVNNDIAAGDGSATESGVTNPDTLSLSELNQFLGKSYKDKQTALKSLKDTFRYVGQPKETSNNIDTSKFISKEQYETDMFYSQNTEYSKPEIRKVIDSIAKGQGVSARDVVASEDFKAIFGKVKGYEESQSAKSVLQSNPRLAASRDKLTQASEALKGGDANAAEKLAVSAVMEAYGM